MAFAWRWYHFYFLLALFDVIVIAASLVLWHRSLSAFEHALAELRACDAKQEWVTHLRRAVVDLNAPGNDVFETRDVIGERDRFASAYSHLDSLAQERDASVPDITSFDTSVDAMVEQETAIFEYFMRMESETGDEAQAQWLDRATGAMALMDRHMASAIASLSRLEAQFQTEDARLLNQYLLDLQRSARAENVLLGVVLFILLGVFWYGRKLQRMHERMIESQQRAYEEQQARLASVGEVCSSVAHGIKNPLAAISTSAQLALEFGTADEPTRLRLSDVVTESRRLDKRVTRLLDFARGPDDAAETYVLREAASQAVHEVEATAEGQGVRLETVFEDGYVRVSGSRDQMVQAVIELVSNALDFAPTGTVVEIACQRSAEKPDHVEVSVADGGPGFREDVRRHACELFYTTKAEGNGIGLASVLRTAELHGGEVIISSADPRGADVRIVIPIASQV